MSRTMDRRSVTFTVTGVAVPKGSMRAFTPKGWNRPILTDGNPKVKGWQQLVSQQAQAVARDGMFVGPVRLDVVFHLPRPASLPKRIVHHVKKPDIDKLARSTIDALTKVLFADDSQVVELHARKVYAAIAAAPSAVITLEEAEAPEPVQDVLREDRSALFA